MILDLLMPGMSGEETLKALKQINPNVAILLSSGYRESDSIPQFTDRDIVGILQKPYQASQLLEMIQGYLSH